MSGQPALYINPSPMWHVIIGRIISQDWLCKGVTTICPRFAIPIPAMVFQFLEWCTCSQVRLQVPEGDFGDFTSWANEVHVYYMCSYHVSMWCFRFIREQLFNISKVEGQVNGLSFFSTLVVVGRGDNMVGARGLVISFSKKGAFLTSCILI